MSDKRFNPCRKCGKPPVVRATSSLREFYEVRCCNQTVEAGDSESLRQGWNHHNPTSGLRSTGEKPTFVPESILQEAERIINGPRRDAYGPAHESFQRIAAVWNAIGHKKLKEPLTGHDVALMMTGLKLCRESNSHGRDNLCDAAGYISLADLCWEAQHPKEPTYAEKLMSESKVHPKT